MDEGQKLQDRYEELQAQNAASSDTELQGQLRLSEIEIKRVNLQSSEMERLDHEGKWLQAEHERLRGEMVTLTTAQPPMATTQATYSPVVGKGVPPGSQFGSSVPV